MPSAREAKRKFREKRAKTGAKAHAQADARAGGPLLATFSLHGQNMPSLTDLVKTLSLAGIYVRTHAYNNPELAGLERVSNGELPWMSEWRRNQRSRPCRCDISGKQLNFKTRMAKFVKDHKFQTFDIAISRTTVASPNEQAVYPSVAHPQAGRERVQPRCSRLDCPTQTLRRPCRLPSDRGASYLSPAPGWNLIVATHPIEYSCPRVLGAVCSGVLRVV